MSKYVIENLEYHPPATTALPRVSPTVPPTLCPNTHTLPLIVWAGQGDVSPAVLSPRSITEVCELSWWAAVSH